MAQQLINQKLESLRRGLARIESRLPETPQQLHEDLDAQDIIALNLTRAIQTCADMATQCIAGHPEITAPQTLGQSFERLAQAEIISEELAINLRKAVGFRNIMVHSYQDIDWNIVFSLCRDRLDDFKAFARAMSA
ncbi:MAG: DUF86 domain-containing protein [Gammaproteobacteria bacterium]|nr:DUF86 domain-containing protein [Gammaproteobacteria bacterium]